MRLHREEPLDPRVARELEAIDVALRGDRVDPELAEIGRLAFELRAERPVPEREFAAELDRLASTGFAPEPTALRGPQPEARRRTRRPRLALAFGGAAAVFIAVTAVFSSGVLDSGNPTSTQPVVRELAAPAPSSSAAAADSASEALQVSPAAPRQGLAPDARRRENERRASLTLATERDRIEAVADDVIAVTDRYRGIVLSSNVSGGSDGRGAASLDLRIPAARLQPALGDLSELAHVRSRTQSSEDVTAAVSSLRTRLRDALAERRSLLGRLGRATTDSESASLRGRIRIVNRRIARTRTAFRAQRNRVDYAAVAVAVKVDGSPGDNGSWSAGDALDDAGTILGTALGVTVVTLAALLPASLLFLLGWAVWRQARRRLRERALEPRIEKSGAR